jgi:hypothetical protein
MKSWCFKIVKFVSLVYDRSLLYICMEKAPYREKGKKERKIHPTPLLFLPPCNRFLNQFFEALSPSRRLEACTLGIEERHCRRKIIVGVVVLTLWASRNRLISGFCFLLDLGVLFLEDLVLWCFLHLLIFGCRLSGVCFDFSGEAVKR